METYARDRTKQHPPFWCEVCSLDLQSAATLSQHIAGRKHARRLWQQRATGDNQGDLRKTKLFPSRALPSIDEEELFDGLAKRKFRSVVVLTGAGVSTSAGVPDFRSPGSGIFEEIRSRFGERFPEARDQPEVILSRSFATAHPEVWETEVEPFVRSAVKSDNIFPTAAHKFCAWLHRQGFLRRVYTQNVDGLHLHPSLGLPKDMVVECHGSARNNTLVMYGDSLPMRFFDCCDIDFPENGTGSVDLIIVMGTSLQVAPFCAVPNMAPRGCTRVLVNRYLDECLWNDFSPSRSQAAYGSVVVSGRTRIGSRKDVPLRPFWTDRKARKKWRQLLIETDCDDFVASFFRSPAATAKGLHLDDEGLTLKQEKFGL
uniref:Deacetylase sirtuin-type domain-containing protein n=1 Tax=Odontella aurita TaxID=265563 RepID=A0A7S4JWF5_9STRA|mmetsp:Transcript_55843/g.167366  ORF Transcript_55843/g.167366 Transcript_55843/m.167366 type:complete len:372 (+) Transcript_55843:144-1259(+)